MLSQHNHSMFLSSEPLFPARLSILELIMSLLWPIASSIRHRRVGHLKDQLKTEYTHKIPADQSEDMAVPFRDTAERQADSPGDRDQLHQRLVDSQDNLNISS